MNRELAKFLADALPHSKMASKPAEALEKKLVALAITPVLISLPLDEAKQFGDIVETLIKRATLANLKTAARAWDKHFKPSKEITLLDLRNHVLKLLHGGELTPPPIKTKKAKKAAT